MRLLASGDGTDRLVPGVCCGFVPVGATVSRRPELLEQTVFRRETTSTS